MPVLRAEAGTRPGGRGAGFFFCPKKKHQKKKAPPRRASYLFFAPQKKSTKKKGAPQSAPPSLCEGANLRRGGCGVRRGTRFAAAQRRSDNHGESVHEAWALRRACQPRNRPAASA